MPESTGTHPFAPFEWMLSLRYLRARRKEGFISVIAGFSFLGIMLGVATLIIVMAVMNGFRQELLGKILGLNGHLLIQPLEIPAHRLAGGGRPGLQGAGHSARRADRRGTGAGVVAVQRLRRAGARHPRRAIWPSFPRLRRTCGRVRSTASTRGRGSPSAAGWRSSSRCAPATISRWWRHAARSRRWEPRRASSPTRSPPCSRSACRNTTPRSCSCRLPKRRPISTAPATSPRSRSIPTIPTGSTATARWSRKRRRGRSI